jgi:lipopolysaccharide biosynthesis glycosyltransferase
MTVNLFCGHDPREGIGTHVFLESLLRTSTLPVTVCFLHKPTLRRAFGHDVKVGTNAFTVSRFLIPYLMQWRGRAIFMDGADMLLRGDLADLWDLFDPYKAVQVVKHAYESRHPRKYVGTAMESANEHYPRKNWASLMLINCDHYAWRKLTPTYVETASKLELLTFSWLNECLIGDLPPDWNWLVDEYGANDEAKLVHWTAGVPAFEHYHNAPHADEWMEMRINVN